MERRHFLGCLGASLATTLFANEQVESPELLWLDSERKPLLFSICEKLDRIERIVGHGNFNLLGFDEALRLAKNHATLKAFTTPELSFIEELFYADPTVYGFKGKRTVAKLTDTINEKEVVKIANSGHFLYKGLPHETYVRILKDVGPSVILTSGIRSVVKQLSLHLDKIKSESGNLSEAARSLVPPGYTYHAIGDFDVGKKGWGHENFTANFARTHEFWKLQQLSYVSMRYTPGNPDGVRFEPWHVRVVS